VEKSLHVARVNWRAPPALLQGAPSLCSMQAISLSRSIVPVVGISTADKANDDANKQPNNARSDEDIGVHLSLLPSLQRTMTRACAAGFKAFS